MNGERRLIWIAQWPLVLILAAAALLPVGLIAAVITAGRIFGGSDVNTPIPLGRAKLALSSLLDDYFGLSLDPAASIEAAHEERDGFRGEGTRWFLVRLDPERVRQLEKELLGRVRVDPRTREAGERPPSSAGEISSVPSWWTPEASPNAHGLLIKNQSTFFFVLCPGTGRVYVCHYLE